MAGVAIRLPGADRYWWKSFTATESAREVASAWPNVEDARALQPPACALRNPAVTPREITAAWIRPNLGVELPVPFGIVHKGLHGKSARFFRKWQGLALGDSLCARLLDGLLRLRHEQRPTTPNIMRSPARSRS